MKRFLWAFAVILLLAAGFFWWQRAKVPTVTVGPATTGTAVDAVTGSVKVFGTADLKLKTERAGRLAEVPVKVGQTVAKGDLLTRQDSRELELQLEQERYRFDAAQERLELPLVIGFDVASLEAEFAALQLEVELGQTPRDRLAVAERELAKRRAQLAAERIAREESAGVLGARVAELEYEAGKMTLTAPFDGEVVEIYAFLGDELNRGQELLRLVSLERLVEMELNEEDFVGVEMDQRVTLRLASFGDREFTGTVTSISRTADSEKKTRTLWVKVEADPSILVPGLTGEGYLVKDERPDAVLIPRRALRRDRVWVVADGVVEIRTVRPGFASLNRAEIVEGLAPGEQVVLEDQDLLEDGDRVRVL